MSGKSGQLQSLRTISWAQGIFVTEKTYTGNVTTPTFDDEPHGSYILYVISLQGILLAESSLFQVSMTILVVYITLNPMFLLVKSPMFAGKTW